MVSLGLVTYLPPRSHNIDSSSHSLLVPLKSGFLSFFFFFCAWPMGVTKAKVLFRKTYPLGQIPGECYAFLFPGKVPGQICLLFINIF